MLQAGEVAPQRCHDLWVITDFLVVFRGRKVNFFSYLVKRVLGIRRCAEVQLLEDHLVLGEGASLVGQEIRDAAELLGDGRGSGNGAGNLPEK